MLQQVQSHIGAIRPENFYEVDCLRACFHCHECRRGNARGCVARSLAWRESFRNLVVTEGLNDALTRLFKTVPADVNWFVGLKGSGPVVAGDTMASHAGWSELTPYTGNRPAFTAGTVAAGSVDNSAAKAVFNINATASLYGALMTGDNSGTAGPLYGAGDFKTGLITGATQANPVVITSVSHGLSTGDVVFIHSVGGMTQINDREFTITVVDTNSFSLDGENGTGHGAYTTGGVWSRKRAVQDTDVLNVQITASMTAS